MAEEKKEYLVLDNEFVEQLKEIPTKIDNLADEMKSMKEEMNSKIDNLAKRVNVLEKGALSQQRRRRFPILQILNDSGGDPTIKI